MRYKYIESMLYMYPSNLEKLGEAYEEFEKLLMSSDTKAQNYDNPLGANGVCSPVEAYVSRLLDCQERIRQLRETVEPVSKARIRLKNTNDESSRRKLLVMEQIFFERYPIEQIVSKTMLTESEILSLRADIIRSVKAEMS